MKRIGIPGWKTGENSFGIGLSYADFISKFGKPVILTPLDSEDLPEVDMILAPGGADILPTSYGAVPSFRTNPSNIFLEHFDTNILPQYIERKTPIFAICRSMQRIWTMYGGQINQHNDWHTQSKHPSEQCHELSFAPEFSDLGKKIQKVTSRHHQCADSSISTPDDLEVIACARAGNSNKDWYRSIVEIFKHKTLPITGVQFHPEDHDGTDQLCPMIIREYLGLEK
jgi:putative glutamine amidotransferase